MGIDELIQYFHSTRASLARSDYCLRRFQAAIVFLEDNLEALNLGKAAVVGSEASLLSKPLIITLYHFWRVSLDSNDISTCLSK